MHSTRSRIGRVTPRSLSLNNERDNQKNNSLVREYVRNFLTQEPIPGIEWEYNTVKMMAPQLKLEMINQVAKSYVTDSNLIVSIMAPDKQAVIIPTKEQILAAISQSKKAELKAKAEEVLNKPLIKSVPKAGKLAKVSENKELGTTEWLLSNSVKVIFKPTTFKKDEILLTAFSNGGISKVKNTADLASATMAATIVSNNGLGEYNQIELGKILTGKIATVTPAIDGYDEGFSGNSSVSDFETLLQLVYLNFTAPRKDDNAYKALINTYQASMANAAKDPRKAFSDTVSVMLSNHNPRTVVMNLETINKLNQDKALAIFKERFAIPANFTFIFTGNIDSNNEKEKSAILTYLGGLKSAKGGQSFTDNGIRKPKGKVNNNFTKEMKVKKASNLVYYNATMPFTMANRVNVAAVGNVLSIRYIESIREKEGGSYGVGVRGSMNNTPVDEATLLMQFDCDNLKQDRLISIIYSEINEIIAKGPRADDFQKVKENMLKKYKEDIAQNNWWSSALERYYQDKLNLVSDYKTAVETMTPESVQTALKTIVAQGNILEVVMKPAE